MTPWLRAFTALTEDLSSGPSMHVGQLMTPACIASRKGPDTHCWSPRSSVCTHEHTTNFIKRFR